MLKKTLSDFSNFRDFWGKQYNVINAVNDLYASYLGTERSQF